MKIFISKLAYKETISNLTLAFPKAEIITIEKIPRVSESINSHPDLIKCRLGVNTSYRIFEGNENNLKKMYPKDCIYNACITDDFFIHNLKVTDKKLKEICESLNKKFIHVNQAYTRCTCMPIGKNGIITSDVGIYRKCLSEGFIDYSKSNLKELKIHSPMILLIEGGHILLPPYKCGFIGGCGGQIENTIFFNGNIRNHPQYKQIEAFIKFYQINISDCNRPLFDIGSILYEN